MLKLQAYDETNIFARILKGEIPCHKVYEDEWALAFNDLFPKAPVHVLLIPKGPYTCASHFYDKASSELLVGFGRALSHVIDLLNLTHEGFRLLGNQGVNAGQEVPHYHLHILAGRSLGPMVASA